MRAPRRLLSLAFVALSLSGCATLFHGTETEIKVDSRPTTATYRVITSGGGIVGTTGVEVATGETPAVLKLSQKQDYVIKITAPGYEEKTVRVERNLNAWTICSALCAMIPAGVDFLTGGMWNLDPDQIAVTLQPLAPGAPAKPAASPTEKEVHHDAWDGRTGDLAIVVVAKDDKGVLRQTVVPLVRTSI